MDNIRVSPVSLDCLGEDGLLAFYRAPFRRWVGSVRRVLRADVLLSAADLSNTFDQNADWFVFAGSLGGFDSICFTGQSKQIVESAARTALSGNTTNEYGVDYRRACQKYTGYFPDNATRLWANDFFASYRRYVVDKGALSRIVVNKPKLEATRGELAGYEFTYALAEQSKYLNLPRIELPDQIEILAPDAELFELAPRLECFPRAAVENNLFIPVQLAYAESWSTLSLGDIAVNVEATEKVAAPTGEFENVKSINGDFEHINVTGGITTPQLTVRIMTATGGIDVTSAAAAKITKVVDGGNYWRCHYRCIAQLWKPLDQAKIQDGAGGFLWALVTSAPVEAVEPGEFTFNISKSNVAPGSNLTPTAESEAVLVGNRSTDAADAYRKSFFIKSCGVDNEAEGFEPYEAKYVGVDGFELPKSKRVMYNGRQFDIAVDSFSIRSRDGEIHRQPVELSTYIDGQTVNNYERVWYQGELWQCVAESTNDIPSETSAAWVKVLVKRSKGEKGDSAYATREIKLFKRSTTPITSVGITSSVTYNFQTGELSGGLNGWSMLPTTGEGDLYVTFAVAKSNTDSDVIGANEWSTPIKDPSVGLDGKNGYNTTSIQLRKRSASAPALPTNETIWNFAAGKFNTAPNNGWTVATPVYDGNPLWETTAMAVSLSDTDNILAAEWAVAVKVVEDGQDGADGETPIIYELSPSATAVRKDVPGVLSPSTVSCRAVLRKGNEREVIGVDPPIEFEGRNYALNTAPRTATGGGNTFKGYFLSDKIRDKEVDIAITFTISGATASSFYSVSFKDQTDPNPTLTPKSFFGVFFDQNGIQLMLFR